MCFDDRVAQPFSSLRIIKPQLIPRIGAGGFPSGGGGGAGGAGSSKFPFPVFTLGFSASSRCFRSRSRIFCVMAGSLAARAAGGRLLGSVFSAMAFAWSSRSSSLAMTKGPRSPPMGPQWAPSGARPRALAQNGCKKIENDRNYAHKYQIC